MQTEKVIRIKYSFNFNDAVEKNFVVNIEKENLKIIIDEKEEYSEWTKLKYFKCPNCPLDLNKHKHCPVAINLIDIIDFFSNMNSYENAEIKVETAQRTYIKKSTVQEGVSSIIGLIMPTSGCPIMGKLKPLVKFHLPFSSLEETEFRIFSMYLIAQYLKNIKGLNPDWELKDLKNIYSDIIVINKNIAQKIAELEKKDASINAVVILNNFADSVSFSIDEKDLWNIEPLFKDLVNIEKQSG
ncbi:MAG: hypothetical protein PVH88_07645 [Ignavibacteria bacterium]|jgi:hypothetical protein